MYENKQSHAESWRGHAEGLTPRDDSASPSDAIRAWALHADATRSVSHPLGEIWTDMIERRLYLVDSFSDHSRSYAIFRETKPEQEAPLTGREREFLERNLLDESEKVIAYDHDISISTVAGRISSALRSLGLSSRAARAPVIVFAAVHAHDGQAQGVDGQIARLSPGYLVVSIRRLDAAVAEALTAAERSVLGLFLDGRSHMEVARARGSSPRTVANQLATAFRKLGVSGRRSVLSHLLKRSAAHPTPDRPLAGGEASQRFDQFGSGTSAGQGGSRCAGERIRADVHTAPSAASPVSPFPHESLPSGARKGSLGHGTEAAVRVAR